MWNLPSKLFLYIRHELDDVRQHDTLSLQQSPNSGMDVLQQNKRSQNAWVAPSKYCLLCVKWTTNLNEQMDDFLELWQLMLWTLYTRQWNKIKLTILAASRATILLVNTMHSNFTYEMRSISWMALCQADIERDARFIAYVSRYHLLYQFG